MLQGSNEVNIPSGIVKTPIIATNSTALKTSKGGKLQSRRKFGIYIIITFPAQLSSTHSTSRGFVGRGGKPPQGKPSLTSRGHGNKQQPEVLPCGNTPNQSIVMVQHGITLHDFAQTTIFLHIILFYTVPNSLSHMTCNGV